MAGNEKTATDQHVRHLIEAIHPSSTIWEQGDGSPELKRALKGGSKGDKDGDGKPEFVFFSDGFLVFVEDKRSHEKLVRHEDDGQTVALDPDSRVNYAVNGAVHYARWVTQSDMYKSGAFAIGCVGDENHFEAHAYWVTPTDIKRLPDLETFDDLSPDAIREFYRVAVEGELPKEERELREVKKTAADLHEDMRNYGSLEGERKATTVSAILLALRDTDFSIDMLRGELPEKAGDTLENITDGWKIYNAAVHYLTTRYQGDLGGNQRRGTIQDQFTFLRESVVLNKPREDLGGKTPLRKFAEKLKSDILEHVTGLSSFDVLGNFYGEFVKYGGSDGNALGIVLTPHHITTLMADLIDVGRDDYVIDPCAGTASFLIAAMDRMVGQAGGDKSVIDGIRQNRLHGIELQDKLYAIGATNMILRGDGKAHFRRDDMFHVNIHDLRGDRMAPDGETVVQPGHGFTRCLMNPPYSQAKNADTRNLSELHFVKRALEMTNVGGLLAAIVPQSAMTNAKGNKATKRAILKRHTLEAVITLNPDTFHGVGVHPVIAIFTAGKPHEPTKRVSFVDFTEDGMTVRAHIGLIGNGTQRDKRTHLLQVLNGDADDGTQFIVRSVVTGDDEWLHSYFYFDDQPPLEAEFTKAMADYLAFQADMVLHGRGELLCPGHVSDLTPPKSISESLPDRRWREFPIRSIFTTIQRGKRLTKANQVPGTMPYVSSTAQSNGIDGFCGNQSGTRQFQDCLTIANSGSVGAVFYHPYRFVASDHVTVLQLPPDVATPHVYLFLAAAVSRLGKKYSFNREMSDKRIIRETILLPATDDDAPDLGFMDEYMREHERSIWPWGTPPPNQAT